MERKVYKFSGKRIEKLNYLLSLPEDKDRTFGLIVFLHGAGERGDDHSLISVHGVPKYIEAGMKVDAAVVAPQCPDGTLWSHLTDEVHEFIEYIIREYHVDPKRVSITGISMGGFGTWEMITTYPEMFAAAAPVCGGGIVWRAGCARSVPVRAYHGSADTVVPLYNSVQMVDALRRAGGNASLTVFQDVGHNSWESAYETTNVISWLASAVKE